MTDDFESKINCWTGLDGKKDVLESISGANEKRFRDVGKCHLSVLLRLRESYQSKLCVPEDECVSILAGTLSTHNMDTWMRSIDP